MRTYHDVTRQVSELNTCTCDLCGILMDPYNHENEARIEAKRGMLYPEGFLGERFGYVDPANPDHDPNLDICVECFDSKVIPALHTAGLPESFKWRRWSY